MTEGDGDIDTGKSAGKGQKEGLTVKQKETTYHGRIRW